MTRECSTELEVNGGTVISRMKKLQVHVVCLQLGFLSRQKLFPIKWAASLKLVMKTIHAAHQTLLGRQIQATLADVFSVMKTKSSFCGCVVVW